MRVDDGRARAAAAAPRSATTRAEQVQVVDLVERRAPSRAARCSCPPIRGAGSGWGWYGFCWYDWCDGAEVVQVGGDALAFRRWEPVYDAERPATSTRNSDALRRRPVEPRRADDRVGHHHQRSRRLVGQHAGRRHHALHDALRVGRRSERRSIGPGPLLPRSHRPHRIAATRASSAKINVPGPPRRRLRQRPVASSTRSTTAGTRTTSRATTSTSCASTATRRRSCRARRSTAGSARPFIVGSKAYMSAQHLPAEQQRRRRAASSCTRSICRIRPIRSIASRSDQRGWGWLLGVDGDRALVTSGWGDGNGARHLPALRDNAAPQFSQFVRTRGWWTNDAVAPGQHDLPVERLLGRRSPSSCSSDQRRAVIR